MNRSAIVLKVTCNEGDFLKAAHLLSSCAYMSGSRPQGNDQQL